MLGYPRTEVSEQSFKASEYYNPTSDRRSHLGEVIFMCLLAGVALGITVLVVGAMWLIPPLGLATGSKYAFTGASIMCVTPLAVFFLVAGSRMIANFASSYQAAVNRPTARTLDAQAKPSVGLRVENAPRLGRRQAANLGIDFDPMGSYADEGRATGYSGQPVTSGNQGQDQPSTRSRPLLLPAPSSNQSDSQSWQGAGVSEGGVNATDLAYFVDQGRKRGSISLTTWINQVLPSNTVVSRQVWQDLIEAGAAKGLIIKAAKTGGKHRLK